MTVWRGRRHLGISPFPTQMSSQSLWIQPWVFHHFLVHLVLPTLETFYNPMRAITQIFFFPLQKCRIWFRYANYSCWISFQNLMISLTGLSPHPCSLSLRVYSFFKKFSAYYFSGVPQKSTCKDPHWTGYLLLAVPACIFNCQERTGWYYCCNYRNLHSNLIMIVICVMGSNWWLTISWSYQIMHDCKLCYINLERFLSDFYIYGKDSSGT